jgi:hypothetical protein
VFKVNEIRPRLVVLLGVDVIENANIKKNFLGIWLIIFIARIISDHQFEAVIDVIKCDRRVVPVQSPQASQENTGIMYYAV